MNSKISDDQLANRLWPTAVGKEDILAVKETLRSTLFFKRTNTKFSADVGITRLENKPLLFNGFEQRLNRDLKAHVRYGISKTFNLDVNYIEGFRSNSSNVLTTRKYYVESETIQPALAWQPTSRIRLVGTFTWEEKVNTFNETSNETASIQEFGLESRFSKAGKTTLSANLRYVDIDFVGIETSSVGYEMLEALRPGQNITWNVSWHQRIGTGLQLVLRYDGRKSGENQAVHLGRV